MTTITINDLRSLKTAAKALDADLREVLAKYGLTMTGRSARIGEGVCKITIQTSYGSDEDRTALDRRGYERYAKFFGLPADGFNAVIELQGEKFRIVGLDPHKPKNCVRLVRIRDGKGFKCPASTVVSSRRVGEVA